MLTETAEGRGESNTLFPWKICNDSVPAAYMIAATGVDQIRLVLSLSGDSRRLCDTFSEHDYKPRGMPNMRFIGAWRLDAFKRTFMHFMGDQGPHLLYHRGSGSLHVDIHFPELVTVNDAAEQAQASVRRLEKLGIETVFPVRVGRADFTGDVLFRSAAYFRYVLSAFSSMLCERGRVVDPFKSSTLYLSASRASKAKRLGRIYDKGAERMARVGWDVPSERYMRVEAESVWQVNRPLLSGITSEVARGVFLDRFGSVGNGTVLLKGGLVEPLVEMLRAGAISSAEYEQLYTFLDLSRMGLAQEVYARDTRLRRARKARNLGLEVPGVGEKSEGRDGAFSVRALVNEIAAAL